MGASLKHSSTQGGTEKGKAEGDTGGSETSSGTDILARIRATAAAKPEAKLRTLTEENRQLQLALSISQAEVERLKEEQEALAEAYTALEREGGSDKMKALKKELAALEKNETRRCRSSKKRWRNLR